MPIPFFLAAPFGKAALGLVLKGLAGKAGAAGAKGILGRHAHHRLARRVAKKAAGSLVEHGLAALARRDSRSREDGR